MDYHNEIEKERDTKIKEKDEEIESLQTMLAKCKACEEEKAERIRYVENILTYLEGRIASGQRP